MRRQDALSILRLQRNATTRISERQLQVFELFFGFLRRLQILLRRGQRLVAEPFLHGAHVDARPQPAGGGGRRAVG